MQIDIKLHKNDLPDEIKLDDKKSLAIDPNNDVIQNYLVSIQNVKKKYALDSFEDPTKKPIFLKLLTSMI